MSTITRTTQGNFALYEKPSGNFIEEINFQEPTKVLQWAMRFRTAETAVKWRDSKKVRKTFKPVRLPEWI